MNTLTRERLYDYISSKIERINDCDDMPESWRAANRVYVTAVRKFASKHFDGLMSSREHIDFPEDFIFKLPRLRGSMWDMGADLLRDMDEEQASDIISERLGESLRHENDPQIMADRRQLNIIATILRANNGSSIAANLYSPLTGLNVEAMKRLTRAEARDLINALKNEA